MWNNFTEDENIVDPWTRPYQQIYSYQRRK